MGDGLILEDAVVKIRIGNKFAGAQPVFAGNAVDIVALAKKIEISGETQSTNVSGASGKKKNRFHSDEETMSLSGVVDGSGVLFAAGFASPVRRNIEVTFIPNSTLEEGWVKVGVITKWKGSGAQGEPIMEEIEVNLSADYGPVV